MNLKRNFLHLTVWFFITMLVRGSYSEIFSSMVHLRESVEYVKKSELTDYLRDYLEKQRQLYRAMRALSSNLADTELGSRMEDAEYPISTFQFLWKALTLLDNRGHVVSNEASGLNKSRVLGIAAHFPTLSDLHGLGNGILAIQEVHNYKAKDVADGKLGKYSSRSLNFAERLTIARIAPNAELWVLNAEEYRVVKFLQWLEAAAEVANSKASASILRPLIEQAFGKLRCVCSSQYLKIMKRLQTLDVNIQLHENCTFRMPYLCQSIMMGGLKQTLQSNFEALCRGDEFVPLYDKGGRTPERLLHCQYSHYHDPRLILNPVKEEELNLFNPRISILHDILTETHVEYFRSTAAKNLRRGTVLTKGVSQRSYHKISQQFILQNTSDNKVTKKLVRCLSAVSKLNLRGFESMMVVNYGSGGVYGIHRDTLSKENVLNNSRELDDRLTTIVTYLNDVEFGGETVFPALGISVKPKKYSAVMFFNLYRNGEPLVLATHSSCPIVYGEKWIANQWIRKHGQEFHYSCSMDKYQ